MEFKLSAALDDQMDSGVSALPNIALGKRSSQDLSSAVALVEDTFAPLNGVDIPVQFRSAEWFESDNYQVALVPLGNNAGREGKNPKAPLLKPVLVLPLTWRELVVRLRAGDDPWGSGQESSVVRFGEVFANFSSMEVSRSEEDVALTTMEFKLFRFLVQNAGRVISRDEMLNKVWGYENYPCTRTVDNHILKLRQKLELDPAHPVHFHTVHGVGYKFVLEASRVVAEHKM